MVLFAFQEVSIGFIVRFFFRGLNLLQVALNCNQQIYQQRSFIIVEVLEDLIGQLPGRANHLCFNFTPFGCEVDTIIASIRFLVWLHVQIHWSPVP